LYKMLNVVIMRRKNIFKEIDLIPSRNCVNIGAVICVFSSFAKDRPLPISRDVRTFEVSTACMRGMTTNPRALNSSPTIAN
jgi:hypothetical protein